MESGGTEEQCVRWAGARVLYRNWHVWGGSYLGMPRRARGRYFQLYSLGGSSDAACGYQYCRNCYADGSKAQTETQTGDDREK